MNISMVGHVCIDKNITESGTYHGPGSPAMFLEKIFRKFPQTKVRIISQYGEDFLPYIKDIDIYPKEPSQHDTLVYENCTKGNMRTQKARNRHNAEPVAIDKELKSVFSSSDILFFAPILPNYSSRYVKRVLSYVNQHTLKILLPQGYYRDFDGDNNVVQRDFIEADDIIPLFDVVIVSEQDHKDMKNIAQVWSQVTRIIITLGEKGSLYISKNRTQKVSVKPVAEKDIVDSIGSGDIFSASFAYKYYTSRDMYVSLRFANNIARQCLFYPADNLQCDIPE